MTNNTIKDQVLSLFHDNSNNEISAADMRVYIEAIFNSKEEKIVKINALANLAANNSKIYEGTLVIIYGDEASYNGVYLSKVNQPTLILDLIKITGLIQTPNNPLMTYDNANLTSPIIVNSDVYTEVLRLTTPPRVQGTYEIKMSMIYSYNTISRSAYFRWSEDGGNTWFEMQEEPKDTLNKLVKSFFHVDEFAGGIKDIIIQSHCENATDILNIYDMLIAYQRVK